MNDMYDQLNIFSYLGQEAAGGQVWDSDINEIHKMLKSLAKRNGLSISQDEFEIWPHVPKYGYRLWLTMEVTEGVLKDEGFKKDIERLVNFAKGRDVELSCMIGACFFFEGEDTAGLSFSTMFMDKKRRREKME